MENMFDVLCSALTIKENKLIFQEEEGTELMCILLKGKGVARLRSLKVLNHALSGPYGSQNCSRFVENQGLKVFFGIFTGKIQHAELNNQDEEHILEIIMSLLNNLKSDSMERIRLLSKFVENDYEKVDRLIEIRNTVQAQLKPIQEDIEDRKKVEIVNEELQLSFYLDRIDAGLFSLQLVDYILAWLIMEDDGILRHIQMIFDRSDASLSEVVDTLKEYYENVGDDAIVSLPEEEGQGEESGLSLKEVIVNLVNYIISVL